MDLDAQYSELTRGALSNYPDSMPSRYRYQIKQWECLHCDFVLRPEPRFGNFGRISHGRAEMRKHLREVHPNLVGTLGRKGESEMTKHGTEQEISMKFLAAVEALLDWMNGNDLVSDHAEQQPKQFNELSLRLPQFRSVVSGKPCECDECIGAA